MITASPQDAAQRVKQGFLALLMQGPAAADAITIGPSPLDGDEKEGTAEIAEIAKSKRFLCVLCGLGGFFLSRSARRAERVLQDRQQRVHLAERRARRRQAVAEALRA